jgi:hypothetical protein
MDSGGAALGCFDYSHVADLCQGDAVVRACPDLGFGLARAP